MTEKEIKERLEYLRGELKAERISYDEIAELQSLTKYIDKDDVELLEAAGVPEFKEESLDEISISWSIDDVKSVDQNRQDDSTTPLTDDECREVLRLAKDNHDANVGINWDVLEIWIDEVREKREQE